MLTVVAFSQESVVKFAVLTEAHVSMSLVNASLSGGINRDSIKYLNKIK